jgi:hypothetical protein
VETALRLRATLGKPLKSPRAWALPVQKQPRLRSGPHTVVLSLRTQTASTRAGGHSVFFLEDLVKGCQEQGRGRW